MPFFFPFRFLSLLFFIRVSFFFSVFVLQEKNNKSNKKKKFKWNKVILV